MVIQILNLDKCLEGFTNVQDVDLKPYIQKATQKVQRSAKHNAPVDTGYLKRSIYRDTTKRGSEVVGRVYAVAEYAIYQEFGTVKMRANPFLFPALDEHRKDIQNGLKDYLSNNLKEFRK